MEKNNKKKNIKQSDKKSKNLNFLWVLVGLVLPPVGLVLFLVWRKNKKVEAKKAGVSALIASCIWAFVGLSFLINTSGEPFEIDWSSVDKKVQSWYDATLEDDVVVTVIALSYCSHCEDYKPVITALAKEKNIKLYWFEADLMENNDLVALSNAYKNSYSGSSPFTMVTKGGKFLGDTVGYMDKSDTISYLKSIGALKN